MRRATGVLSVIVAMGLGSTLACGGDDASNASNGDDGGGSDATTDGASAEGGGDSAPPDPTPSPFALDLGSAEVWSVASDPAGNTLVAGESGNLVDSPLAYFAKLDDKGSVLWSKTLGAGDFGDYNIAQSVATDAAGDMVFAGYVKTSQDFGGQSLAGGFAAKWKSDGTLAFVKSISGGATPNAVFVAPSGDVYVAGEFEGSADLGGGTVTSTYWSTFFVHYDSAGNYIASKFYGGGNVYCYSIAVDGSGGIVMTGIFDGSFDFGGGGVSGPTFEGGQEDGWIARLDPTGGYVNAKRLAQAAVGGAYFDATGNVVTAGSFTGTLDLGGGTPLTSAGSTDLFVATLDSSLGVKWAKPFGDASAQGASALAAGKNGEIVVGGVVSGNVDLGTGPLLAGVDAGYGGPFVARFDATGKAIAATAGIASPYGFYMHGVSSPTHLEAVAGGWYGSSFTLGPAMLTEDGGAHEGFVVRLAP